MPVHGLSLCTGSSCAPAQTHPAGRATAVGWTSGTGRFGAVIGTPAGRAPFASGNQGGGFTIFAAALVATATLILVALILAKGARHQVHESTPTESVAARWFPGPRACHATAAASDAQSATAGASTDASAVTCPGSSDVGLPSSRNDPRSIPPRAPSGQLPAPSARHRVLCTFSARRCESGSPRSSPSGPDCSHGTGGVAERLPARLRTADTRAVPSPPLCQ